MANVNDLNTAWIEAGNKVADLQDKKQQMATELVADPAKYTNEEVKKISDDLKNAKTARDFAKSALDDAKESAEVADKTVNIVTKEADPKKDFVDNFRGMLKGDPKIMDLVTSSTDESGNAIGLTIPQDIETQIHELVRQYDALQQYVNVESVSTQTGSRVWEKWTDVTPLADLDDETATIGDNDDPHMTLIKYAIHRYAGITTATNSLLKDSDQNILAWLTQWIARKTIVTRNNAIIAKMNAAPTKPTIAKFDDVIDMINTSVDPAIKSTSFLMTNVSGCNELCKVKDALGNYLLQPNSAQPDIMMARGKRVVMVADKWLPNSGTAAEPVYPLYYGDLSQAVTLFDRENMSLLTTNIGGGAFEKDQTKVRVIDRFDVESTDSDAFVAGSFSAIANQTANFAASAASNG
ncbi:phage major capsid protein [Liquorilactobacillus nagelii]|uniref:phage major capsid protein n=1 Tax=Liquorilactobacillus nagelii TaxID=82688 RepID=UPI0039EA40F8